MFNAWSFECEHTLFYNCSHIQPQLWRLHHLPVDFFFFSPRDQSIGSRAGTTSVDYSPGIYTQFCSYQITDQLNMSNLINLS